MTKFNCGYIIWAKKEGSEIEKMKKSVYSLLLSDDFIEKIDELAAGNRRNENERSFPTYGRDAR